MGNGISKTSFDKVVVADHLQYHHSASNSNKQTKNPLYIGPSTNRISSDIILPTIQTPNSSITMNTTNNTAKDEENTTTTPANILIRVQVAQCKLYGFGIHSKQEGFRELFSLREYKESYYPLGCYYQDFQHDAKQALYWFEQCDNSMSKYRTALILQEQQQHDKAFEYMSSSAHLGNKYAQFMLGIYYEHGILVKQSKADAKTWYERSAKNQEFAEAQTALANLLLITEDKLKNEKTSKEESLIWLYKAASQGNASAFIRLGSLHEQGILVQQQGDGSRKAIDYYKRATIVPLAPKSVLALAHYLVGINYRIGDLGLEEDSKIAFLHLSKSASLDYAPAQRALGLMYAQGDTPNNQKDFEKSHTLLESAASQGDVRSLCLMADIKNDSNEGPMKQTVILLYERAAKLGSIAAQLSLALHYQRIEQFEIAFQWFERASKSTPTINNKHHRQQQQKKNISILDSTSGVGFLAQRNTARLMVARYRYNGWGNVKQDTLKAFEEFKALSDIEEFSDAYYWVAACYEEMDGDFDAAFKYYKKAAVAGDVDGQFQTAYMLSNGYVSSKEQKVKRNMDEAFSWYMKAADRGHNTAQYCLGLYYETGLCAGVVEMDIEKAIHWYKLAAKSDNNNNRTLAMVRLARLLDDTKESIQWLQKAIAIGDVAALRELATFYENGLIEESDESSKKKKAFELFQLAANQDDPMSWHALSKYYDEQEEGLSAAAAIVPVNLDMAINCLKKAEDLGYSVAGLDLADLLFRNHRTKEAIEVYRRLTDAYDIQSFIGCKARLGMAKIIVFENNYCATKPDQLKVYSWLINMQSSQKLLLAHYEYYPQILETLGQCAEFGIGTPIDKHQSIRWYKFCANEEGNDWAIQRSLCRLVNHAMSKKEYKTAQEYLERLKPNLNEMNKLSEDANMQACHMRYHLGFLYKYGLSVEKNEDIAMNFLTDAADGGDVDAMYELGKSLIPIDEDEAKHRLEEGVMEGHAGCMRALAMLLIAEENDQDILDEQDEYYDGGVKILRLLETASELEDAEATYQLAIVYENGIGTTLNKNLERSLMMYIKAAELGHEQGMIKAGEILGNSLGKHVEAIFWFQKAVNLFNNIKAKVMLISYDFQEYTSTLSIAHHDDAHNFQALQTMIDNELEENTKDRSNFIHEGKNEQRQSTDELTIRQDGLGLAFYILGQCHELGKGTSVDTAKAKEWYHRSVLMSQNIEAMWRLGVIYSTLESNDSKALEWYRNAAEKGHHRESHYQLGLFHLNGLGGLEKNIIAAQKYFSKASDQGHSLATFELARIIWNHSHDHIHGYQLYKLAGQMHVSDALRELGHLSHTGFSSHGILIVHQDYKRAFAYYCEAAQMGDPTAALMVGNYFEEGYLANDLGQDCERALQWYESAYRLNGGALAELAIGKLKHTMAETISNLKEAEDMREEAFVWFESAANNNPMDPMKEGAFAAKMMVALYHLNGWGRKPQDAKTGFAMLLDLAESGNSLAFVSVARCYEEGIGTEQDIKKAISYYEMAADMNDPGAFIRLGKLYEQGLTGLVDKEAAKTYYHRAQMMLRMGNHDDNNDVNINDNKSNLTAYSFTASSTTSSEQTLT